jgi:hypothetical protein
VWLEIVLPEVVEFTARPRYDALGKLSVGEKNLRRSTRSVCFGWFRYPRGVAPYKNVVSCCTEILPDISDLHAGSLSCLRLPPFVE